MPVFNQKHILINASLQCFLGHLPEERYELAKLPHLGELLLEILPDLMRLPVIGLRRRQQNLIGHLLVKVLLTCTKLSQFYALNITIFNTFMQRVYLE